MEDINETLEEILRQDYSEIKTIPNKGICGLGRMAFTVGLFYGMDEYSYEGRYCYHSYAEAKEALSEWDGKGDPSGNWIKHKGHVEYSNINYNKNE